MIDNTVRESHRRRNMLQTGLLIAGMVLLLALTAYLLTGSLMGVLFTVVGGVVMMLFAPRATPAMVLRMYRARKITAHDMPQLVGMVAELADRAGMERPPALHYVPSKNMNAFAVGTRDDSAIAVTDGLLRGLTLQQLAGVLAHEISHIANEDVRVMGLADMINRLTGAMQTTGFFLFFLGLWQGTSVLAAAVVLLIAPLIGGLLQLALSRTREYDADLDAAELTGRPDWLASALRVLERKQGALWESLALPGSRIPDPSLLRTHPKTEDRVARLEALAPRMRKAAIELMDDRPNLPATVRPVSLPPRFRRTTVWF